MSFLKKFGQIAGTVGKIAGQVAGILPAVPAVIPGVPKDTVQVVSQDLNQIAAIALNVEVIGQALGLTGTQKLTAASPLVAQVILQSSILANHKISNPDLFKQGVDRVAGGMADILNSLEDKVEVVDKA